jgi:polar amino acid transport system permease protein
MQQSFAGSNIGRRPRSWLVVLDIVFYAAIPAALVGLAFYFFHYRDTVNLYFPEFLSAAGVTIGISVISMVLATIFGFIGALGRLSRFVPIRFIAAVYVEVIRGTPILVQLFVWGFGLRSLLAGAGFDPYTITYNFMTVIQSNSLLPSPDFFDAAFFGIIALSFNYGAYLTEVFRSGIETVPVGQTEAALSLGLNSRQIMRKIVLPQAFRITIPPFTNYFITLVQDSALLSVIGGVIELQQSVTAAASAIASDFNLTLFIYVFGALMFFCICYPLALLARYLESRFGRAY